MRSPPPDVVQERLARVLAEGRSLREVSLSYLPKAAAAITGSHVDRGGVTLRNVDRPTRGGKEAGVADLHFLT